MDEDTAEVFISETAAFISQNEDWLESTINSVGWTLKDLVTLIEVDKPEFVRCPIDPEHRIPATSLDLHLIKCEKHNASYPNVSNLDLSASLQGTGSVCKLEFARDVVRESETVGTSAEKASSSQTLAELLKAERDAKRRRAAHRGKRVHSNKKSYNEVMREVIASQMQTLSDNAENDEDCSKSDSKANNQKTVEPNFSYLGMGAPYYRGNPYKRWLTIEREEEETIAKMQKQSAKREDDHRQHSSRQDNDYRFSRRDYRDDREHDRYHSSSKRNHDYRRDERRYGENRKESRDRFDDERYSRRDETRRERREYRDSDGRDQKQYESKKFADYSSKNRRESRPDEYRKDPDPVAHDEVVKSSQIDRRRDRRDYKISDTKNSKCDESTKDEHRSYRKGPESRRNDSRESSSREADEELVTKREQSFHRSEESNVKKKPKKEKKEKKKKKKHKHKKKHKRSSSSD